MDPNNSAADLIGQDSPGFNNKIKAPARVDNFLNATPMTPFHGGDVDGLSDGGQMTLQDLDGTFNKSYGKSSVSVTLTPNLATKTKASTRSYAKPAPMAENIDT